MRRLQDGKNTLNALSCKSLSAKEPLIIGLFCGKRLTKIRHPMRLRLSVQGGEDSYDASSCKSYSAKQPLIIGLFCGKRLTKIRHPMRTAKTHRMP